MFSTVSSSLTMNLLVYEKNSPNLARTSCFCLACEHLWMQTSKTFVPVITKPFFFFLFSGCSYSCYLIAWNITYVRWSNT